MYVCVRAYVRTCVRACVCVCASMAVKTARSLVVLSSSDALIPHHVDMLSFSFIG